MKDEITYKLTDFLEGIGLFRHECEAVYVMVELRKLIDHYNATVPLVKFYADWTVHTRKDRIDGNFKRLAERIFDDCKADIIAKFPRYSPTPSPIVALAHGDTLGLELQEFLLKHSLPSDLTQDSALWGSFINKLIRVLENQPVVNPCDGIQQMFFVPSADNCVQIRVEFATPIEGKEYYLYGSVLS
jgi:hypothetical protein